MNEQQNSPIHSRYLTLGGAHVVMANGNTGLYSWAWECEGCRERSRVSLEETNCRDAANRHAGTCRSLPQSAGRH